ncbi:MAG: Uma2 family endonuclease [Lachnospiraceae bacterium]|nr:Uma2 family endonuclease [Lachnospiraceae bacterium]
MEHPKYIQTCTPKRVYGAPDFCMEVLSPGTRRKDFYIKLNKYRDAGVREYWMIDPDQQYIIVNYFESETSPEIYPLYGPVPVHIFDGQMLIDLSTIRTWLEEQ